MEARDYVQALIDGGMTQQQIADKAEIPQGTISKIVRGQVKDVLSVNYRKLQTLHAEKCAPKHRGAKSTQQA
jgi:transcriptional regulator with XRE-family HTH domain